jgi:DNA polymerase III alpha subunit (gram-positive type)
MSKYYSIDVECVATGTDHNSRAVAQISLVDQMEQVRLNLYVVPSQPVVSYLTPLTGITKAILEEKGVPLEEAISTLRAHLPPDAVLVGQNIGKDVEWLNLRQGKDFESMMDLAGMYRTWNDKYKTWSIFGQDHVAKVLLGWDNEGVAHDAVTDAVKSIRLFNHHQQLQQTPGAFEAAQQALLATPPAPSFAKRNPIFDGVCMGNRKQCSCGAPFFGG